MSFNLKTMIQPFTALSTQQKKLDRLIDKIAQQKLELAQWQQAEEEIRQYEQLEQLWQHLHEAEFSKAEIVVLDEKIQSLVAYRCRKRIRSMKLIVTISSSMNMSNTEKIDQADTDVFEEWDSEHFQQVREQARLKRQQEKQAQAAAMAEQSLKTVYLKIAAAIHPDREANDVKKIKTIRLMKSRIYLLY